MKIALSTQPSIWVIIGESFFLAFFSLLDVITYLVIKWINRRVYRLSVKTDVAISCWSKL